MLLILSTEEDASTNQVIDWLLYFKVPVIRVNDTSSSELININLTNDNNSWCLKITESFKQEPIYLKSDEINGFWYRRGLINLKNTVISIETAHDLIPLVLKQLDQYLQKDKTNIVDFIYLNLKGLKHLGYFHDNETIKLNNLVIAKNNGLNIPKTIVATRKGDIQEFISQSNKCITKGINNNGFFVYGLVELSSLTQLLESSSIEELPDTFAPSIIQEYIEKFVELRIFYIERKCYASAIFSQSDEKTKIDFRDYNYEKPNRVVPFKLPSVIENNIIRFMENVGMKTGSIDMVLSTTLEYVFLEVNPIGQFDWISKKCNYNLEKVIATYFKN